MRKLALAYAAVFLAGPPCEACLYFPEGFDPSQFRENKREALMFRSKDDAGVVNLVFQSSLQGRLPDELAWVLPFPSMPDVKEADPEVFDELRRYFAPHPKAMPFTDSGAGGGRAAGLEDDSIEIHPSRTVGNHEIVPIEIKNADGAGEEMNTWLHSNGYIELPAEIQKPYLKKGAVFLAIKVRPEGDAMELKPLWISYRAERMEFPLRFTHDYRTIDLDLYLIHDREPAAEDNLLASLLGGWRGILYGDAQAGTRGTAWGGFPPGSQSQFGDVHKVAELGPAFRKCARGAVGERLEKITIEGVNTRFRTRDLESDPGI